MLVIGYFEEENETKTYTTLGNSGSEVDSGGGGGSGRAGRRGSHGGGGEDGQGGVNTELHDVWCLCVYIVLLGVSKKGSRECIKGEMV